MSHPSKMVEAAIMDVLSAYEDNKDTWTGIYWPTDGHESYTEADVERDAASAEGAAKRAMQALFLHDWKGAGEAAAEAYDLEVSYGDAPTWGPLRDATEALVEAVELWQQAQMVYATMDRNGIVGRDAMTQICGEDTMPASILVALWRLGVEDVYEMASDLSKS